MRPWCSTSRSALAAALAVALLAAASPARAQPCCGGASAFAPARLTLHEDAIVGLSMKGSAVVRSFDEHGAVVVPPTGSREVDLEQDVVAAVRFLTDGQASILVPLVETYRRVPGLAEAGAGYGDIQLAGRWDFVLAGQRKIPGIAALAGVTLPTGVPPDKAEKPLATDATGVGALQASAGAAVEQVFGPVLVNLTGTAAWRAPRSVGSLRVQPGLQLVAFGGVGVYLPHDAMLALSLAYTSELTTRADGEAVPDSARAFTRVSLGAGLPLLGPWRMLGSLFADPPIAHFGLNQPASLGGALLVLRGFS
jgi:hypothetical protein